MAARPAAASPPSGRLGGPGAWPGHGLGSLGAALRLLVQSAAPAPDRSSRPVAAAEAPPPVDALPTGSSSSSHAQSARLLNLSVSSRAEVGASIGRDVSRFFDAAAAAIIARELDRADSNDDKKDDAEAAAGVGGPGAMPPRGASAEGACVRLPGPGLSSSSSIDRSWRAGLFIFR